MFVFITITQFVQNMFTETPGTNKYEQNSWKLLRIKMKSKLIKMQLK